MEESNEEQIKEVRSKTQLENSETKKQVWIKRLRRFLVNGGENEEIVIIIINNLVHLLFPLLPKGCCILPQFHLASYFYFYQTKAITSTLPVVSIMHRTDLSFIF